MSSMITPPAYGMKAVRQIKAKNTTSTNPVPSSRLQKKKEKTYSYFLEKVDPLLGECITHLLLSQPHDIPQAMIDYFQKIQKNAEVPNPLTTNSTKPKRELKLFLATNIGPVIAKVVNRLAVMQPETVIDFILKELESIKVEDSLLPDTKSATSHVTPDSYLKPPEIKSLQIGVLGVGNSGKSSILNMLQGKYGEKMRPTIGFRPSSMMFSEDVMVRFYDLGGGKRIRDIWNQYYHDIHAVIYVIDSSLSSEDDLKETVDVFESTLNNKCLVGKPLLIFANKQDQPGAKSAKELQEILPLADEYNDCVFIAECSSLIPDPLPENFKSDSNIETAVEMLCKRVLGNYEDLHRRVEKDSQAKAVEEAKKRIEREKKVLRNKIASAFIAALTASQIESLQVEADEANVFTEDEGVNFLSAEIGEEVTNLPSIALKIAAMTGYQRLALQIVGALKVPISKKKTPMKWEEIHDVIAEIRTEIGLPDM
jgi:ADP-ribosylation factor-like protein 13B